MTTKPKASAYRINYQFDPAGLPVGLVRCHIDYVADALMNAFNLNREAVAVKADARGLVDGADHRLTAYAGPSRPDEVLTMKACRLVLPHLRAVRERAELLAAGQPTWTPGRDVEADTEALQAIARQYVEPTPGQREWLELQAVGYGIADQATVDQWPAWELAQQLIDELHKLEEHADAARYLAAKNGEGPARKQKTVDPREYGYQAIRIVDEEGRVSTVAVPATLITRACGVLRDVNAVARFARGAARVWTRGLGGARSRSAYVRQQLEALVAQKTA